jgi:folate-binding protein YgfZ
VSESAFQRTNTTALARAIRGFVFVGPVSRDVLRVSGRDALDLLHRLSTNDLGDLGPGEVRETVLTTDKGRIVDLLIVARFGGELVVVCSGGRGETVRRWIEKFVITDDVSLDKLTDYDTVGWFIGHDSISTVGSAANVPLAVNSCVMNTQRSIRFIALDSSRGLQVFVLGSRQDLGKLFDELGVQPLEPEQAELLRVSLGVPCAPNELSEEYTPYDVGLADLISFTKGCYVGQEVIARLDTYGKVRAGLAGVEFADRISLSVPATLFGNGETLGRLTSITTDQHIGRSFGLAVVRLKDIGPGDQVRVESDGTVAHGRIVELPIDLQRT